MSPSLLQSLRSSRSSPSSPSSSSASPITTPRRTSATTSTMLSAGTAPLSRSFVATVALFAIVALDEAAMTMAFGGHGRATAVRFSRAAVKAPAAPGDIIDVDYTLEGGRKQVHKASSSSSSSSSSDGDDDEDYIGKTHLYQDDDDVANTQRFDHGSIPKGESGFENLDSEINSIIAQLEDVKRREKKQQQEANGGYSSTNPSSGQDNSYFQEVARQGGWNGSVSSGWDNHGLVEEYQRREEALKGELQGLYAKLEMERSSNGASDHHLQRISTLEAEVSNLNHLYNCELEARQGDAICAQREMEEQTMAFQQRIAELEESLRQMTATINAYAQSSDGYMYTEQQVMEMQNSIHELQIARENEAILAQQTLEEHSAMLHGRITELEGLLATAQRQDDGTAYLQTLSIQLEQSQQYVAQLESSLQRVQAEREQDAVYSQQTLEEHARVNQHHISELEESLRRLQQTRESEALTAQQELEAQISHNQQQTAELEELLRQLEVTRHSDAATAQYEMDEQLMQSHQRVADLEEQVRQLQEQRNHNLIRMEQYQHQIVELEANLRSLQQANDREAMMADEARMLAAKYQDKLLRMQESNHHNNNGHRNGRRAEIDVDKLQRLFSDQNILPMEDHIFIAERD